MPKFYISQLLQTTFCGMVQTLSKELGE